MKTDKLDNIADVVEEAIHNNGKLKEGMLRANWLAIVEKLANKSQPEYIKDGVLVLTVEGPLFIQHFMNEKQVYIDKVNEFFKEEIVKDLDIKSGKIDETRQEYMTKVVEVAPEEEDEEEDFDDEFDHEDYREDDFDEQFEAEQARLEEELRKELEEERRQEEERKAREAQKKEVVEQFEEPFDMSGEGIIRKLKTLEKMAREREKYLLQNGYKKCRYCGVIFEATDNEEFCTVCITAKNDRKMRNNNF